MKKTSWIWILVIGLAALAPAALRSAVWLRHRVEPVKEDMARAGKDLFHHEWLPNDPLANGGDGVGPVFNENSCVACHSQNGPGGSGLEMHNVTTFAVRPTREGEKPREGVIHAKSTVSGQSEGLNHAHPSLPNITQPSLAQLVLLPGAQDRQALTFPAGVQVAQLNTPALFGAKLIDDIPEREILANARRQRLKWGLAPADGDNAPVGHAARTPAGKIGRFGWKGQTPSLAAFVQAACANELGLGNPGAAQPKPLFDPNYQAPGMDLTQQQCDQLTAFVASLPRPIERLPDEPAAASHARSGKELFNSIGCADCHTPSLGGVEGLYSDLLQHHMGADLQAGGAYYDPPVPVPDIIVTGPSPRAWRTPPLWGVADSAPYLHDGRAKTLEEAIRLHGGQGLRSSQRFTSLPAEKQTQLVTFLKTLRAPQIVP